MRTIAKTKMLLSIFLVAFITTVVGCFNWRCSETPPSPTDEGQILSNGFATVADVVAYQVAQQEIEKVHTLFIEMNQQVLANVAGVILNRNMPCTEESIIQEYILNQEIYDNLVCSEQLSEPTELSQLDTAKAKPPKIIVEEGDTVIGGIIYQQKKYRYE